MHTPYTNMYSIKLPLPVLLAIHKESRHELVGDQAFETLQIKVGDYSTLA
jgi:hypothetical protein